MDTSCIYRDTRDELIVGYLYNDIDPADREAFELHLPGCEACRTELEEFGAMRVKLSQWAPPEPALLIARRPPLAAPEANEGVKVLQGGTSWRRRLAELPAWAQAAAAMLVLGAAAGLANMQVTYDAAGLTVRTGWMSPPAPVRAESLPAAPAAEPAWRADLAALAAELRGELQSTVAAQAAEAAPVADAATLRRVQALIEESEKRQQRELALRVAEVATDIRALRTADLRTLNRNINQLQNTTGVDMMRLYRMQNDLALRVAQGR